MLFSWNGGEGQNGQTEWKSFIERRLGCGGACDLCGRCRCRLIRFVYAAKGVYCRHRKCQVMSCAHTVPYVLCGGRHCIRSERVRWILWEEDRGWGQGSFSRMDPWGCEEQNDHPLQKAVDHVERVSE